jgi:hypothetical protein
MDARTIGSGSLTAAANIACAFWGSMGMSTSFAALGLGRMKNSVCL